MQSEYELVKYPLVIEPAANFVEAQVRATLPQGVGHSTKTFWAVFQRLPQRWNYPLAIDNNSPHLFGNSKHLKRCNVVLAYDATGAIAKIFCRTLGEWACQTLSEEQTGAVPTAPSVRLVFGSEEERHAFVRLLRAISKHGTAGLRSESSCAYQALAERAIRSMRLVPVAQTLALVVDENLGNSPE